MEMDSYDDVNSFSTTPAEYSIEKRLQDFEELFTLLFENSHDDVISFITSDGLCKYVSPAVHILLGYEPLELIGTRQYDYLHPEDLKALKEQSYHANGVITHRVRHKNGQYIWFETDYKTIRIMDLGLPSIVCISRDITVRKEAEEELRESEEKFRNAFDYAPIGMAVVDLNGRWIKVNRELCNITGYSEQEMFEIDFQKITHTDDLHKDLLLLERLLNHTLTNFISEKRYVHKSGRVVWVLLGVSMVHDKLGHPLYFIAHVENITDKKNLEELKSQQEELIRRTDKISTIGQLAASIAHEIRNPLTTIRGFIQLMNQKKNVGISRLFHNPT